MVNAFLDQEEQQVMDQFLKDGYYIFKIEDEDRLRTIHQKVYQYGLESLKGSHRPGIHDFFDNTQDYVTVDDLNDVRVSMIKKINADQEIRPLMYQIGKKYIHWIVGNELAMQRTVNLSIQLPKDDSSLLPVHSDVWMGNSPYEVVFWLPLVDCYKTKSMFVLPRYKSDELSGNFEEISKQSADALYKHIEKDLVWVEVPFGHGVIFTHSTLHGNVVNTEPHTRWSFNVRFKSLLTPYTDKALGESFLPISSRPATKVGYEYIKPRCA